MLRRRARRVLHPSDFSLLSDHAFVEAIRWARTDRADLLLLHVIVPVSPIAGDDFASNPWLYAEITRVLREAATETLRRLLVRATKGGVRTDALVCEGVPANQIVHVAESRDANLIVMGSRGRTGVARLLFGDLASAVVASAPCPVLLVGASPRREPVVRHLTSVRSFTNAAADGAEDTAIVETLHGRPERSATARGLSLVRKGGE